MFAMGCVQSLARLSGAYFRTEKNELVKQIIARLARGLKYLTPEERAAFELPSLPIEAFLEGEDSSLNVRSILCTQTAANGILKKTSQRQKNTPSLFDDHEAFVPFTSL